MQNDSQPSAMNVTLLDSPPAANGKMHCQTYSKYEIKPDIGLLLEAGCKTNVAWP